MHIELKPKPTYILKDGRVKFECEVDGQSHRIFLKNLSEFMDFLDDQLNALRHHLTGKTREEK